MFLRSSSYRSSYKSQSLPAVSQRVGPVFVQTPSGAGSGEDYETDRDVSQRCCQPSPIGGDAKLTAVQSFPSRQVEM